MRSSKKMILAIAIAGSGMCAAAHASSIYVSGFNAGEVYGAGADPNDTITADVDGALSYWTGAGYNDGVQTVVQGLPTGPFASATGSGVTYQLQPFNVGADALRYSGNTPSPSVTVTPGKYSTLDVLATTGSGGGTSAITLTFSDTSTDTISGAVVAPDWGTGGNVAVQAQRTRPSSDTIPNGGITDGLWDIYESVITLSATDAGKTLVSVSFLQDSGHGISNVYAINGTLATPEPASLCLLSLGGVGLLARRRKA